MRKRKQVLTGYSYESLEAKIRYMLSLSLLERYAQGIAFAEILSLAKTDKRYRDDRKAFGTVQVIKKK